MGSIFYIMGKSSSGKDTIYSKLLQKEDLGLAKIVLYTTRPVRASEQDGVEYHFVSEKRLQELMEEGKVIEMRTYHVVGGVWKYFTVDDGNVDLRTKDYLAIGTLVSYEKWKEYYGPERIVPIYIETADDIRLERALIRERLQQKPRYEELCRRFLADSKDFCEEQIRRAGIKKRFSNDRSLDACLEEIAVYIRAMQKRAR